MFEGPKHTGPPSDHFDGMRFRNQRVHEEHGFRDFLRWTMNRERSAWRKWIDVPPGPPPPKRVDGAELRATFIGHTTVLLQSEGVNILTDPVWSDRVSPVSWIGPKRHRAPGIRFEDLPPIDIVLVSHNHYDHMDRDTLRRLSKEHSPAIVTSLGNRAVLDWLGVPNAIELDWWQNVEVKGRLITATPAEHFSGRGTADRNCTLWCGFIVDGSRGPIYFAGDTGMGPQFQQVRDRFGLPRLSLLPIGAYRPRWFMEPVHMAPEDALDAHEILGSLASLATHWGTFALADDGEREPVETLERLKAERGTKMPFRAIEAGESWTL